MDKYDIKPLESLKPFKQKGPKKIEGRKTTTIRISDTAAKDLHETGFGLTQTVRMLLRAFFIEYNKLKASGKDTGRITINLKFPEDYTNQGD